MTGGGRSALSLCLPIWLVCELYQLAGYQEPAGYGLRGKVKVVRPKSSGHSQ